MKKKGILFIIILVFLSAIFCIVWLSLKPKKKYSIKQEYKPLNEFTENYTTHLITSYQEYKERGEKIDSFHFVNSSITTEEELEEAFHKGKSFLLFTVSIDVCHNSISFDKIELDQTTLKLYLHESVSCGVCSIEEVTFLYEIEENITNIERIEPYMYVSNIVSCDMNVAYKPILYFYPLEPMDIKVTFANPSLLTYTYPKYENSWDIHITPSGTIYDYRTKRNYYALYWEGIDSTVIDTSVGFVVKGEDTVPFLEEKLSYLGLNEREINEFIIYWLDKLEKNPYNYIHFRTTEDMESYMKLHFSKIPDTLIRIMMDYSPLSKKIQVKEQKLEPKQRKGFTIVEWGGRRVEM